MEPSDEDREAVAIWQNALIQGRGQVWEDCRSITIRRRGRTLCRFFEPYVWVALGGKRLPSAPDGWWRLHCDPMSAKQKRAMARSLNNEADDHRWYNAARNYVRSPLVLRVRLDAAGNLVDSSPIVNDYDLDPGDREIIVFPNPLGPVPATVLYPVLTKFADHSIAAVELDTLIAAINRNK
jgi:hypothetical protein